MGDLTPRHCLTVGRGRGLQEAVGWGVSPELFASDGAGTFTGEENRDSTERKMTYGVQGSALKNQLSLLPTPGAHSLPLFICSPTGALSPPAGTAQGPGRPRGAH